MKLGEKLAHSAFGLLADWNPATPQALDEYTAGMSAVLAYYRTRAVVLGAVQETAAYDQVVRRSWDAQLEVFDTTVRQLLHEEQIAGRTSPQLDVATASRLLVWGGMQAITKQVLHGDPLQDATVARELAAAQWFGIFRRPSATT